MTRTYCKYGDCSLEKLEIETTKLNEIWSKLEKNWENPTDYEDLYRVYPLLDTTAALARKMLHGFSEKNSKYKLEVVLPSNLDEINTSKYIFANEKKFFNGKKKKQYLLSNIVSTFLHANEYVYMDTRTLTNEDYDIYVLIKTDQICYSCAEGNLENPKIDNTNYRKSYSFVRYDDCICGKFVNVRTYIEALLKLIKDRTENKNT